MKRTALKSLMRAGFIGLIFIFNAAVYRDGVWYLLQSTNGFAAQQFGLTNDQPVPAAYLP